MRFRYSYYSLLLVCVIPLVLQISYAQNTTIQEIPSLIIKIKNLKGALDELESKLVKIQETNGTNDKCNCEDIQEQIDDLKSQLEDMEEIVNATDICDCEVTTQPPKVPPSTITDGIKGSTNSGSDIIQFIMPVLYMIPVYITSWFTIKHKYA